jgi:hypothetical protein
LVEHSKFDKSAALAGTYNQNLGPYNNVWMDQVNIDPTPNKFLIFRDSAKSKKRLSLRTKIRLFLMSLKYFKVSKSFRRRDFLHSKSLRARLVITECEKGFNRGLYKQLPAWPQPLGNGFFNFRALKPKDWNFSLPIFYQYIKSLREFRSIFGMGWWKFSNCVANNYTISEDLYVNGIQSDEGVPLPGDSDYDSDDLR